MFSKLLDLYNKGNYNELLKYLSAIDKNNTKDCRIENLRGLVNFSIGNRQKAIHSFEEAIFLQKTYIDPYVNLGKIYLMEENYKEANKIFLQGLENKPNHPVLLNHLGIVAISQKNFEVAKQYFQDCIKTNPNDITGYQNLGNLFYQLEKFDEAIPYYKEAIAIKPTYEVLKNLGFCYFETLDIKNSNFYLNQAISIKTSADLLFQISYNYKIQGDINSSDKHLIKSFKANSSHSKTIFALSKSKQSKILDCSKIKELFTIEKNSIAKGEIGFALFNLLHAKKNYKEAAYYLDQANENIFKNINMLKSDERKEFAIYKKIFDQSFFNKHQVASKLNQCPVIFIVGMPRSGSTLIEQIISSHSNVTSFGEKNFLFQTICKHYPDLDLDKFEKDLNNSDVKKFEKIMNEYVSMFKIAGNNKAYLTDKMLSNFRFIGFIKAGMPNAKIIYCKRNPKDNWFSIYNNYFGKEKLSWVYNKKLLVDFYHLQEDLMDHWLSIFKKDIFVAQYESFVTNLEDEAKNLIQFLDLEWQPKCLEFYKNTNIVQTASSLQVRKELYSSSINQWENYKDFFKEYFNRLV